MIRGRTPDYRRWWHFGVAYLRNVHSQGLSPIPTNMHLPPMPTMRELLQIYKINAQKHLSQNFLLEPRLIEKIARASGVKSKNLEGTYAVEVGPGPGGIARALLQSGAAHVTVIEKDRRFLPTLEMLEEASGGRLRILIGDVMSFDMCNLFPEDLKREWEEGEIYHDWSAALSNEEEDARPRKRWKSLRVIGRLPKIHVVGNLPFNISTPLLIRWIKDISLRKNVWEYGRVPMTLTFQKEVAERIVADVGDEQRCRLSVMCQNWCYVDHKFTIPGKAFVPKPKVDVGVVRLVPRPEPLIPLPFHLVEKVVRTIFSARQKHIRHTAANLFPPGKGGELARLPSREELREELIALSGVKSTIRAFRLTIDEFGCLCKSYAEMCERYPGLEKYEYRGPKGQEDDLEDEIDEKVLEEKWAGFDNAVGRFDKLEERPNASSFC